MKDTINKLVFIICIIGFLVFEDFYHINLIQNTDFCHTFYAAGYMVNHHLIDKLYFNPYIPQGYLHSDFNIYNHKLLPDLDTNMDTYFFYPPITAIVISAFCHLPFYINLFIWQILSIWALAWIIKKILNIYSIDSWLPTYRQILFMPVVITILMGQVNIIFGLLPLTLSYLYLLRQNYFLSGIFLGLVLLKPQFLPISLLVIGAYFLTKNFKPFLGFLVSISAQLLLTYLFFSKTIFQTWFMNFHNFYIIYQMENFPNKLIASLASCIMLIFTQNSLYMTNLIFLVTFGLSLHCLYISYKIIKTNSDNFPLVYLLGIFIVPIITPHFLFYDLTIYSLAAIIILILKKKNQNLINFIKPIFIIINLNALIIFEISKDNYYPALFIQLLLMVYYFKLLNYCQKKVLRNIHE